VSGKNKYDDVKKNNKKDKNDKNDKDDRDKSKDEKTKENKTKDKKEKTKNKNTCDSTNKTNQKKHNDNNNESEDESDDESEYETESIRENKSVNDNIIMTITYGDEYENEENVDEILNNEDEDCNSEDEKTFMNESYEKIEEHIIPVSSSSSKKSKRRHRHHKRHSISPSTLSPPPSIENEYKELLELKKQLAEKLVKTPNSNILLNAVKECNKEIKQLVIKTRRNNTKEYYKLTNDEPKHDGELEYFKKKLSHKEQLKIMEDLKAINAHIHIDKPYRLSLLQSNIPPKYKATVMQKLNMMRSMEPGDSEYHKLKMWIDTFMRIPFNTFKDFSISMNDGLDACNHFMNNAKNTLDECTYGLNDAKMQIMQLVGQWITNPKAMGTAIAIYGPKGTGKTSLSKDGISKIFGREFSFISLGGSGDSSFLEGHSYTYEGSTWGKIVQILIESKCMNPIIYFDELDKISDTPRGQEITGILTHLTDTTQNNQFHDKYFNEVDFDLSRCLFIFSYNDENAVNPILKDRMYRIQTKGYDVKEKIIIAKKYLLPKIREQVNFKEGDIIIPDEVIQYIVSNSKLTQNEEGVRNLKRCLEIIHTKLNLFRLMHNTDENSILGKNVQLKVEFPYTISKNDVDILIKNDEKQNQSLLSMYV
jgi:ATP-dependent Lon protease